MADLRVIVRLRTGQGQLLLVLAFMLILSGAPGVTAAPAAPAPPSTAAARPSGQDVLVTSGETRLVGTLEEGYFSIEALGTVFQLPLGFVSALTRLENGQVRLELVNRDVLTGALRNRVLAFSTPTARMEIPVEKVRMIALQARQTPPESGEGLIVTLRNGDVLVWAPAAGEEVILLLQTTFSDAVRLQLDKIKEVRFAEARDTVQMRNGDLLYGRVQNPFFRVRTYYQTVEIPRAEVASLGYLSRAEAKARFAPSPSPAPAAGPASQPPTPPAANPATNSSPAGAVSAGAYSAKALSVESAEPLADPRVSDIYQPFGEYTYGSTGGLAVAVGVPGTGGEKVGREIWVYRPAGKRLVIGGAGEASWPAWSPDGQKLAYDFRPFGSPTSEIWLTAADGTGRRQLSRDSAGSHAYLAWSPDGKRLAYVYRDYHTGTAGVSVLNLDTGVPTALISSNLDYFSDLAWSSDGRKLLVTSGVPGVNPRSTLKLIEVASKTVADLLPKSDRGVNDHPRWSPDGREIAFSSDRSGQRQIWAVRMDGENLRQLTTGDEPKDYPTWSPDGQVVLYFAGRSGLGNLWLVGAGGGESVQLTASGRISGRAEWAPDGKRLAFTKREQSQQLWTATLAVK